MVYTQEQSAYNKADQQETKDKKPKTNNFHKHLQIDRCALRKAGMAKETYQDLHWTARLASRTVVWNGATRRPSDISFASCRKY